MINHRRRRILGLDLKAEIRLWLILLACVTAQISALGQMGLPGTSASNTAAAAGSASDSSAKTLEARLVEARSELASTLGESGLTNVPVGIPPQESWVRRVLLQRLVRVYEQQLSSSAELETTKSRTAEKVREAQTWARFAEPLPYSILLADRLREELQSERLKLSSSEAAAGTLDQLTEEHRKALGQAEERIRQLNEQLEGSGDATVAARLSWQREMERLRSQVAAGTMRLLDMERQISQERATGSRSRLGLLQRQLVIADAGARFTQADLDQVKVQLDRVQDQLERELAEAQVRRNAAVPALETARAELRVAKERTDSMPAVILRATELVAARESQLEAADTAIRVLRMMLEGESMERSMWELRFAAYDTSNVDTLRDSGRRLEMIKRRLTFWRDHERQQADVSSSQILLQQTRLNGLAPDSELLGPARDRLAALNERDRLLLRLFRNIERMERLTHRWEESLSAAEGKLPLSGRVENLFSDGRSFFQKFWKFELLTAEDTITVDGQKITGKRSVTIGKILMAIFILVAGIWITGVISRFIEPLVVQRFKIEPNQASLVRRWLRAVMVVCLVLFSLVLVKIPLTVFAFAGGALAIGLGFGTQTFLKNLVSGIIILFERPFRVGDVLDVGGQRGAVTSVGLRASVLQLWDGTEALIPNSALLENNLTNWTYSNRTVRFTVTVGVAYGSDPRRVIQLLSEVAERHGLVEADPKPMVLFTEFGDSTLTFEIRFWVDITKANSAQVSSDLRLMIASSFAEHGIVIDFPQRDIHLHAASPIPVEVVPAVNQIAKTNQAQVAPKPVVIP